MCVSCTLEYREYLQDSSDCVYPAPLLWGASRVFFLSSNYLTEAAREYVGRVIGCSESFFMYSISVSIYRITYSVVDVPVTVHRDKFLTIKPTRLTNFSNLFWNEALHVSDSSSFHHQEFFTVHAAMVYVIQVC